jgi:hypothetical protein
MPNATAQLVVGILFRRGVFFFSRGIGGDVLRNLFSSKDLLWEQVKAESKRRRIMRLQSRAREWIEKESLLSNGPLLWWGAALLDWLFPFVRHGLGGFFLWRSRERRCEVMEVYTSGFAEYQGGYFISCESALGVMTSWCTLMGIPNGRVFSPNVKGFSLNSVHGCRMRIFFGFYAKGQEFVRIRLG